MNRTAIYRHFAADGALLYIGISDDPAYRLHQHMHTSPWRASIASVTIEWFDDRPSAVCAEVAAIMRENPAQNRASKGCIIDRALPFAHLLDAIHEHLTKTGMSKSAFGTFAVGDPAFVTDLEKGREIRSRVVARVQEYMATGVTHEAAKAKVSEQ